MVCPSLSILLSLSTVAFARPGLRPRSSAPSATLNGLATYQGFTESEVDWFRGIPYAAPPDQASTRFKPAQAPLAKSGVQSATQYQSICAQKDTSSGSATGSEDCLYLNVARPSGVSFDTKLPVIVWIHGGGFWNGASYYDGDPTSMVQRSVSLKKPIMFVSIQYRLNAFGFLYHPDVTTPAMSNLGLTDQVQALRFLQTHLPSLGGDPTKVTIWGQSAGATSVEALAVYAPSGLFRAAISDSGYLTSSNPAVFSGIAYAGSRETSSFWALASQAGCGSEDSTSPKTAWDCLEGKDSGSLQSAVVAADNSGNTHWAPVIVASNGSLVDQLPQKRLNKGTHNKIPMMVGNCKDDGSYFASSASDTGSLTSWLENLGADSTDAAKLMALYAADSTISGQDLAWVVATDWNFQHDRRRVASSFSKTNNATYTFLFSQAGPDDPSAGAHHSADLLFLFGKDDNQNLEAQMQSYWVNFVHDLDPNGDSLPSWPLASSDKVMQFLAGQTGAISDSYRRKETSFINPLQRSKAPSSSSSKRSNESTTKHRRRTGSNTAAHRRSPAERP